jgi:hypothetical protein
VRILLSLLLACLPVQMALAAPEAQPWPRWERHDAASTRQLDHSAWDGFLARHLRPAPDGLHRLAYGAVTAPARAQLQAYLQQLQAVPVSQLNRAEQRAYWINLYNAQTVETVLAHYPVASILKINTSPGLLARGPWGDRALRVEGERLSLDDIEHRILRPIWRDPLIHYGVNCASVGCPNLAARAFTASNSTALLEAGARDFVNHPRGARVEGGRLRVSSLYVWFKADFGGDDAGVIAHLRRYATPALAAQLDGIGRISGHDYDWSLNDAP